MHGAPRDRIWYVALCLSFSSFPCCWGHVHGAPEDRDAIRLIVHCIGLVIFNVRVWDCRRWTVCGFACITGPLILVSNHSGPLFGVAMVAAIVTLSPEVWAHGPKPSSVSVMGALAIKLHHIISYSLLLEKGFLDQFPGLQLGSRPKIRSQLLADFSTVLSLISHNPLIFLWGPLVRCQDLLMIGLRLSVVCLRPSPSLWTEHPHSYKMFF